MKKWLVAVLASCLRCGLPSLSLGNLEQQAEKFNSVWILGVLILLILRNYHNINKFKIFIECKNRTTFSLIRRVSLVIF
jgi:hypothetical protein